MRQPLAFNIAMLPEKARHLIEAAFLETVQARCDTPDALSWLTAWGTLQRAVTEADKIMVADLPPPAATIITAARERVAAGDRRGVTMWAAVDAAYGPAIFDPTPHWRQAANDQVRIQSWGIIAFMPPGLEPTRHVVGTVHTHPRIKGGEPYVSSPLAELDVTRGRARTQRSQPIELVGDPLGDDELRFEVLHTIVSAPARWGLPQGTDWRRVPLADERIIAAAAALLAGDTGRAMAWYERQPMDAFGGLTAQQLVAAGRGDAVLAHLETLRDGGFA